MRRVLSHAAIFSSRSSGHDAISAGEPRALYGFPELVPLQPDCDVTLHASRDPRSATIRNMEAPAMREIDFCVDHKVVKLDEIQKFRFLYRSIPSINRFSVLSFKNWFVLPFVL